MFFLSLGVLSQTTAEDSSANKNKLLPSENIENLIHIGDLIDVDVVGSTEYDWRGNLTPEGFLDGLSFVEEPVFALCQTENAVAAAVVKGYEKLLRAPQVVVKIIDRSRRPESLLYGAVKTPQRFQIYRPVRLNELIILAGGITEKASGEIQILRSPVLSCAVKKTSAQPTAKNENQPEVFLPAKQESGAQYLNIKISDLLKGQAESNPLILSGDVITVFDSKPIYVTGGVASPKQISARAELSISRAVAAAGGLIKNADPKKVAVFRVENNQTKVIEVDLDKIKSGEAEDLLLQAFDIVEVSQKGKGRGKYLPPSENTEESKRGLQNLPLKVID